MIPRRTQGEGSIFNKSIALGVSVCLLCLNTVQPLPPAYAASQAAVMVPSKIVPVKIPADLGTVEEFSSGGGTTKTLIYIQDAHDSLEAQENIAGIIRHLVDHGGIKTVYEEGYQGKVPTDEFFGKISDADLKERVSYYFMDRLRIGAAEYAHINRGRDFELIGADDTGLHLANVAWYQKTAVVRQKTEKNLEALRKEITLLANRYFPAPFKAWIKIEERYRLGQMDLTGYLKQLVKLWGTVSAGVPENLERDYPQAALLLRIMDSDNRTDARKLKALDSKALFIEINRLENLLADKILTGNRERRIFDYSRSLALLARLNQIRLSLPEYQAVADTLRRLKTEELAGFIVASSGKSLVLSKRWEENIQKAVRFYEAALARDVAIEKSLQDFVKRPGEDRAVLVFGGFHQAGIREILERHKIGYAVISPKISAADQPHQKLYREIMSRGVTDLEVPDFIRQAARPVGDFLKAALSPRQTAVLHGDIRGVSRIARSLREKLFMRQGPRSFFDQGIDRELFHTAERRSEARSGDTDNAAAGDDKSELSETLGAADSEQTHDKQALERHAFFVKVLVQIGRVLNLPELAQATVETDLGELARLMEFGRKKLIEMQKKEYEKSTVRVKPGSRGKQPAVSRAKAQELTAAQERLRNILQMIANSYLASEHFLVVEGSNESHAKLVDLENEAICWREGYKHVIDSIMARSNTMRAMVQPGGVLDSERWAAARRFSLYRAYTKLDRHAHQKMVGAFLIQDKKTPDHIRAGVLAHQLRVLYRHYYPLPENSVRSIISYFKEQMNVLDRVDPEKVRQLWGETVEDYRTAIKSELAFLYLSLGTEEDVTRALEITSEFPDPGPGRTSDFAWYVRMRIRMAHLNAKKILARQIKARHADESQRLFHELAREWDALIEDYSDEDMPPTHKTAWKTYGQTSLAYYNGDLDTSRAMYNELQYADVSEMSLQVLSELANLHRLQGSIPAARQAVKDFFKAMIRLRDTKSPYTYQMTRTNTFILGGTEHLDNLLKLSIEIIEDPTQWPEDLKVLTEITHFVLSFRQAGRSEGRKEEIPYKFASDLLRDGRKPYDNWPQFEAILQGYLAELPFETRSMIIRMMHLAKGKDTQFVEALRHLLVENARQSVARAYSFYELLIPMSSTIPGSQEQTVHVAFQDLLSAQLIVSGYRPEEVFQLLVDLPNRNVLGGISGGMAPLFYNEALRVIIIFFEIFKQIGGDEWEQYKTNVRRALPELLKTFSTLAKRNMPTNSILNGYFKLADMAMQLDETGVLETASASFIRIFNAVYVNPETGLVEPKSILGSGESLIRIGSESLLTFGRYINFLADEQRDDQILPLVNVWWQVFDQVVDYLQQPAEAGSEAFRNNATFAIRETLRDFSYDFHLRFSADEKHRESVNRFLRWSAQPENLGEYRTIWILIANMAWIYGEKEAFKAVALKIIESPIPDDYEALSVNREAEIMRSLIHYAGQTGDRPLRQAALERSRQLMQLFEQKMAAGLSGSDDLSPHRINQAMLAVYQGNISDGIRILEAMRESELAGRNDSDMMLAGLHLALLYILGGQRQQALELLQKTLLEDLAGRISKQQKKGRADPERYRLSLFDWTLAILPQGFRNMLGGLILELMTSESLAGLKERTKLSLLTSARCIDPVVAEQKLFEHVEALASEAKPFDPVRDMPILGWLAKNSEQTGRLNELVARIIPGFGRKQTKVPKPLKDLKDDLASQVGAQELLKKAELALSAGKYPEAERAADLGLKKCAETTPANIRQALEQVKARAATGCGYYFEMQRHYREGRFSEAAAVAGILLNEINNQDEIARRIIDNAQVLEIARKSIVSGNLDTAANCLSAIPAAVRDQTVQAAAQSITRFKEVLQQAHMLIHDQYDYGAAETILDGVLKEIETAWGGASVPRDQTDVRHLLDDIRTAKGEVAELKRKINEGESLKEIYQSAQDLTLYPAHREDPFQLLLARGFDVFNSAASRTSKPARDDIFRRAFNLGRLVYELYAYCRARGFALENGRYPHQAELLVSQAVANIWLPDMVDSYFQVASMVEAEKIQDEEDRRALGLPASSGGENGQRAEFQFQEYYFRPMSKTLKVKKFEHDMTKFVMPGDTFMMKSAGGKELLHYVFKVKDYGTDYIVLEVSDTDESFEIIKQDIESVIAKNATQPGEPIGSLIRTKNTTWSRSREVAEPLVRRLKQTTVVPALAAGGNPAVVLTPDVLSATTGHEILNELMGISFRGLSDTRIEEIWEMFRCTNDALVTQKEAALGQKLDPSQRAGVLSALTRRNRHAFFWGPPGTGKTNTINMLVELLLAEGADIYVESHQNKAVDNIAKRLITSFERLNADRPEEDHFFFARGGNNYERIGHAIQPVWERRAQLFDQMVQRKRNSKGTLALVTIPSASLDHELLMRPSLRDATVLIIDEATQATPMDVFLAVGWLKKLQIVVLAGDPKQLPAHGLSDEDVDFAMRKLKNLKVAGQTAAGIELEGFGFRSLEEIFSPEKIAESRVSLFEKAIDIFSSNEEDVFEVTKQPMFFFDRQRRSVRPITDEANYDYKGRLLAMRPEEGIFEIDDTGRDSPEIKGRVNKLMINPGEVDRVVHWIDYLLNNPGVTKELPTAEPVEPLQISVRSPYNDQLEQIGFALRDFAALHAYLRAVEAGENPAPGVDGERIRRIIDNPIDASKVIEYLKRDSSHERDEEDAEEDPALHINYIDRRIASVAYEELRSVPDFAQADAVKRARLINGYRIRFIGMMNDLLSTPMPAKAKEIREFLRFGERFIPVTDIDAGRFDLLSVDSSIGNEYRLGIVSMVRSNQDGPNKTGLTGFLSEDRQGREYGRRRRLVANSRDKDGMILIMSVPTFHNAASREIKEWAEHTQKVYEAHLERKRAAARSETREQTPEALRLDIEQMLDQLGIPAMVHIDYDDLMHKYSPRQREEFFALTDQYAEKIRLVIYGADTADEALKPFWELMSRKHNVRITASGVAEAFDNAQKDFVRGFPDYVNLHFSKKHTRLKEELGPERLHNIYFFRYGAQDDEVGLLAAALLWKDFAEAGRRLDGIGRDEDGYLSITDPHLRNIIQRYEASLVVKIAA